MRRPAWSQPPPAARQFPIKHLAQYLPLRPQVPRYFPRDVFFFFGVTALPLAAACFCFFFAGMLTSRFARKALCKQDRAWLPREKAR